MRRVDNQQEGKEQMSDKPDWERPEDDTGDRAENGSEARPPYPGWSADQPTGQRWTSPSQQSGWTAPGQPSGPTESPHQTGWADYQHAGWTGQEHPSGWQTPDYPDSRPQPDPQAQPGMHTPPGGPPAAGGWGAPAWEPPPPSVKPGVIPLRPLGVGEILDGAVTTIRRNPGPMLGLSAVVAVIVQLFGLFASWVAFREFQAFETLPSPATTAELFGALSGTFGAYGVMAVVNWVATVILTGILTVVVGRAVLGHHLTVGEAWAMARARLLRLLLLTLAYAAIVLSPAIAFALLIVLGIAAGADESLLALAVVVGLAAGVLSVWLYVRYTLAGPALMLESTAGRHPGEPTRPIGIGKALRRSAQLVTHSWWRIFVILILLGIVVSVITQVVSILFSVPMLFMADPSDLRFLTNLGVLSLTALGGIISTTITAPFMAAAVALLYIDRRIRREALDIQLARAAGVTIPGRTDQPPSTR